MQSRCSGGRPHRVGRSKTKAGGHGGTNYHCLGGISRGPQELRLPNAPEFPLVYDPAADRPQPRLDVERGAGMSASIGRLRPCSLLDWKFTVLSHNTIRGAAGAAVLSAELLKAQGYLC